jgi:hypothetical protein
MHRPLVALKRFGFGFTFLKINIKNLQGYALGFVFRNKLLQLAVLIWWTMQQ